MVGYESPDWGMGGWYEQEERAQLEEEARCRNYAAYWDSGELLEYAQKTAHEYRVADEGERYEQETWEEWLVDNAQGDEDLLDAVLYAMECADAFTFADQIDRLADGFQTTKTDGKKAFDGHFPETIKQLNQLGA